MTRTAAIIFLSSRKLDSFLALLKFCYKLKLKSEDLDKLYVILKNTAHEILCDNTVSVLSQYNTFSKHILESARNLLPAGKGLLRSKVNSNCLDPAPWWNERCDKRTEKIA